MPSVPVAATTAHGEGRAVALLQHDGHGKDGEQHDRGADDAGRGREQEADDATESARPPGNRPSSREKSIISRSATPERSSMSPMKMNMGKATSTQFDIWA
jgi:hypothetical protein